MAADKPAGTSFFPPVPDLAGRLPSLDQAALNQGADLLPLDEQRARFWTLARFLAGAVLWPFLCLKLAGLGWLGGLDALVLAAVGSCVCALGVAWHLTAFRQDRHREALRRQRAGLENRLMVDGWSTLYTTYEQASRRVYGRPVVKPQAGEDPVLVNLQQFTGELDGIKARLDTFAQQVSDQVAALAGAVQVAQEQAAVKREKDELVTAQLHDVGLAGAQYYNSPAQGIVERVIHNRTYGLRELTQGTAPHCTRTEYQAAMALFRPSGVFFPVAGAVHQAAPELMAWRDEWKLAGEQDRQRIEDEAHAWVVGRLAGPVAARVSPLTQ